MISYKKDILLKDRNIYSCLVKPLDLRDKNFIFRTPNVKIVNKKKLIGLTKNKFEDFNKGFLYFVEQLEKYLGIKYASKYNTKYRLLKSFKKNKINIVFLRVMGLCLSNNHKKSKQLFNEFLINDGYINVNNTKIKIDNFGKRISYLIGVIAGDGHLDKRECELIIVDGQTEKNRLKFSEQYLQYVSGLFKKEFDIKGWIAKRENYYEFRISNKWLCRFINYYFNIPFGKKSDIVKLPEILYGKNEKYFWRGMMDTDGYIRQPRKQISLKSNSLILINQFKEFCEKNNINTILRKEKRGWSLAILSGSILNYAKLVGFCHPRKRNILIDYLKDGPKYKVLKQTNKKLPIELAEIFKYLRPYKMSVYIKLDEYSKKADKQKIKGLLDSIKSNFDVSITETKRNRYNNQFNIYSKKFVNFVKNNAMYDLPWQPLNKSKIDVLLKEWIL